MGILTPFRAVAPPWGGFRVRHGLRVLFLALLLGVSPGCAPAPPAPENAWQGLRLSQFLAATRDEQTFKLSELYTPPKVARETPTGLGAFGPGYALLSDGPAALDLARGASAYADVDNGLAVGLNTGDLRVFGARSCPGMDRPTPGAPRELAWGARSRLLAVLAKDPAEVYLYDTERCRLADVLHLPEPVTALALSASGDLLAAAGKSGRILVGPPRGSLEPAADVGGPVLALGFGPEGGMLFTATPRGEITLINVREREAPLRFTAKGGPFVSARFEGEHIVLGTKSGRHLAWNLVTRAQEPFSRKLARFFLDKGVLRYRTWNGVLHLTPYPDAPRFAVDQSPSRGLIRVLDLDGRTRYYAQDSGREVMEADRAGRLGSGDWLTVQTNARGNFCIGKRCYALTDRAFQWDHDMLLCRNVPGLGWFLWWVRSEHPEQFSPLPDHLPERESILADEAVEWVPIAPPKDFP